MLGCSIDCLRDLFAGYVVLLVQAELMVSDLSTLHETDWHHVVFEGTKRASPAAVAAAAKCVRKWGPTFISDGTSKRSKSETEVVNGVVCLCKGGQSRSDTFAFYP